MCRLIRILELPPAADIIFGHCLEVPDDILQQLRQAFSRLEGQAARAAIFI